jgi:hypothetical protein
VITGGVGKGGVGKGGVREIGCPEMRKPLPGSERAWQGYRS